MIGVAHKTTIIHDQAQGIRDAAERSGSTLGPREAIRAEVERRLVEATWTLRRLPDRESGYIYNSGVFWPDMRKERSDYLEPVSSVGLRKKSPPTAAEVSRMQPALDLMLLLPCKDDRRLVFFAAYHQDGEPSVRISWSKVRRSLDVNASRWTLKRNYDSALMFLAGCIDVLR